MKNKFHCPVCRGEKLIVRNVRPSKFFYKYNCLCDTCGYMFKKRELRLKCMILKKMHEVSNE